ncbi:MAG: ComF family protein [Henriciella sp.]|nr:ComF family protein [Henriciella sp.]
MGVDMHWAARSAKVGIRSIVDFVWPSRSIVSGERHGGTGAVPAHEFANLQFLIGSGCRMCAVPMEVDLGEANLCGACAAHPKAWDQGRAAIAYDDVSRQIILDLKHAGRRDGLATMTNWMAMAGQDILQQTDWLVPVPLHYQRLAKRGFNQSVWLAQGVARQSHNLVLVDALKRTRATPSQGGLTAKQRRDNVKGAFSVRPSRAARLNGATVTLVDDVYTTGSTLSACAKALKQAGAASVNILVLARVVREADITI